MIRYSIIAYGKVQGVGFRYFTAMKAMEFNLYGFCKNLPDGTVHIEVQGEEKNISLFISAIKTGNGFCRVDDIKLDKIDVKENCTKYHIM